MNHMTTYERIAKKNPRFNGKTLHDEFIEASSWYKDAYNKWVVYDGDTFEFMNVDFYKTNIYDALEEVWEAEDKFVWEFNQFIMKKPNCPIAIYGPYGIARANYPFAKHITNPNHYTMFNNGTVHINLTLPTKLDLSGTIENMDEFVERHRVVARYIQWFEPLLVLVYGQEDPFRSMCSDPSVASRFSGGSQRLAVSRYIGLSNYDTAEMPRGKILTEPAAPGTWYDGFYKVMAYERLTERGFDINFNKHLSHGIELRIFDGLRRQQMLELCETIARICRLALARPLAPLCKDSADFSALAVGIMIEGADYLIPYSVVQGFLKAVRLEGVITIDEKEPIIAGVFVGRVLAWVDNQPMLEEYAGAARPSSK
jgi:hypothetical protein